MITSGIGKRDKNSINYLESHRNYGKENYCDLGAPSFSYIIPGVTDF